MSNQITQIFVMLGDYSLQFKRGIDFDEINEMKEITGQADIILYKDGKRVKFIHHNTPVMINYCEVIL